MNSKDLTVAALSSGTTDSATERYTIMRGSTRNHWRTREELRIAIITWIERTYHRRRRKAGLGRLIPIEYEGILAPAVDLAA